MRVGRLLVLSLFLGGSAYAIAPQCSDGIDNDGDGLIDFAGDPNTLAGADPQCRSPSWNSESTTSDMGPFGVTDAGLPDGGVRDGGNVVTDAGGMFQRTDGGTTTGGGGTGAPNAQTDPPRQGCDVGGSNAPTLPILVVLAVGGGLALLSRRKRA